MGSIFIFFILVADFILIWLLHSIIHLSSTLSVELAILVNTAYIINLLHLLVILKKEEINNNYIRRK